MSSFRAGGTAHPLGLAGCGKPGYASTTQRNAKDPAMRLLLPAASICAVLACPEAFAQSGGSLFGSPDRVPANPFASNYPSAAPPRSHPAYERSPGGEGRRRVVRPERADSFLPPRDIPR